LEASREFKMGQFKIGDVVVLKSGGPKMTVNAILPNGRFMCAWFVGATPHKEQFNTDALEKAED
jgi:uncharacterized protein YodC (DUF2158 family)